MTRNIPQQSLATLCVGVALACSTTPTGPPVPVPECVFTLSSTAITVPSSGGTGTVTVTASAGSCQWTAGSTTPWLAVTAGSPGTGSGTVSITAQANTTTAPRSGAVVVAGTTVTVQQAGLDACTFAITPARASFGKDSAAGTVQIATASHCAWQATSATPWITITAHATGTGTAIISYTIDRNLTATGRTGTIAVAGLTFSVDQDGDVGQCTYAVSPVQWSVCMAWPEDLISNISTQEGCPWTATASSGWLSVSEGASGVGSGTIRVRGSDNYDARRTGIVQVRWPTPTAGQNLQVDQAGCQYGVSHTAFAFSAAPATGRFDVLQQSDPIVCGGPLQNGCVWSAVTDVSWITMTSTMPRSGDDAVAFSVAGNTSGSARTGIIRVRDRVVTITQGG